MDEDDQQFAGDTPPAVDRRLWPRYTPNRAIPVTFFHPRQPGLGAGDIVDLSAGGARIVAPPSVTTPLRWGDPVTITLAYSEETREAGLEGLTIESVCIEVISNASAYTLRARFFQPLAPEAARRLAGIVR